VSIPCLCPRRYRAAPIGSHPPRCPCRINLFTYRSIYFCTFLILYIDIPVNPRCVVFKFTRGNDPLFVSAQISHCAKRKPLTSLPARVDPGNGHAVCLSVMIAQLMTLVFTFIREYIPCLCFGRYRAAPTASPPPRCPSTSVANYPGQRHAVCSG